MRSKRVCNYISGNLYRLAARALVELITFLPPLGHTCYDDDDDAGDGPAGGKRSTAAAAAGKLIKEISLTSNYAGCITFRTGK